MSIRLGIDVGVGNQLHAKKREGQRSIRSGMRQQDARGSFGSALLRCELAWDEATEFGIGKGCSEVVLMT